MERPSHLLGVSFAAALLFSCRPSAPTPATIEDIQYAAVAIDMDTANLREDTRRVESRTGPIVIARFRNGRELRKLVARQYDDIGQTHFTFYLHDGVPFLVINHFIWFRDQFSQGTVHTVTDSLYYAQGKLLRAKSVDSPAVGPLDRQLTEPLDSATARLQKFLALKPAR